MSNLPNNSGIVNLGGTNDISNNNLGGGTQINNHGVSPSSPLSVGYTGSVVPKQAGLDVGVVTFLAMEMRAVTERLDLRTRKKIDGLFFSTGEVATDGGTVSVVATMTHSPGQRSVMSALDHLRRHFSPRLWILVGIGGGLHPEYARIGNVIVSTRIVYYDSRKIRAGGEVQTRGEERQAPARIGHAVNVFFTDRGEPAMIRGQADGHRKRTFEVRPGLIGSGEAVIADGDSDIHRFLGGYNDKILAVDMESGGLSQYWQENSVGAEPNPDWVVVRGISDNADQEKNDDGHELAARNAAHVVKEILPYLC
ncbi:hypothetical protein [Nocardiopsis sp. NPDC058789]|uniref:5'-methylthioadenosine/S-adenosylhomocysteine nucleosidase family protein n=1 Tax=Nocardiopsis sp. NPDC058789 TaxID=3346634 RepID=UPI0036706AD4